MTWKKLQLPFESSSFPKTFKLILTTKESKKLFCRQIVTTFVKLGFDEKKFHFFAIKAVFATSVKKYEWAD